MEELSNGKSEIPVATVARESADLTQDAVPVGLDTVLVETQQTHNQWKLQQTRNHKWTLQ